MTFNRYSIIDFFRPIDGSGWHSPEMAENATYRWSTAEADLVVPNIEGMKATYRVFVNHMADPHLLQSLEIRVADTVVPWTYDVRPDHLVILFSPDLQTTGPSVTLSFDMAAVREQGPDGRMLGIAVSRVDLLFESKDGQK